MNKILSEKEQLIAHLNAFMEALSAVIGKNIELVLHDLKTPESSVINIVNGHISGRKIGSPLCDSLENDIGFVGVLNQGKGKESNYVPEVYKHYQTITASGLSLHSATVLYRDEVGLPSLSLCINADHSLVDNATKMLSILLPSKRSAADEESITSLEVKMNEIISSVIPIGWRYGAKSSKKDKIKMVKEMQSKGLFIVRGGVEKAAKMLGVTRFTIYNYLDEIKTKNK